MDDSKSVSIISFHEFSRLHSLNAGFSYFQTKKGKKQEDARFKIFKRIQLGRRC